MKSNVIKSAQIIFSKIYFEDITDYEIINWIKKAKETGFNTQNIELALNGTQRTKLEIIKLFLVIIKELNINNTKSPEELFINYAMHIACSYLDDEIIAKKAIHKLLIVTQNSENKDNFYPFIEFCLKHNILLRNLEFINTKILNKKIVINELDEIFLKFAENNHQLKLRQQLEKRSINQIIFARYHDSAVYDRLSIFIMDDIISKCGLDKSEIDDIIKQIKN